MNTLQNHRTPASSPAWVWLVTGTFAGLFIAFLVHLAKIPFSETPISDQSFTQPLHISSQPKPTPRPNPEPKIDAPRFNSAPPQKFSFYTQLPQAEVFPNRKPAPVEKRLVINKLPERLAPKTQKKNISYLIQAGSFRQAKEAENLRVEMILLGLEPSIEVFETDGRKKWHRVLLGPFDQKAEVAATKDQLRPLNLATTTHIR